MAVRCGLTLLQLRPIAQIAKDLGIAESCLRNWMRQADLDDGRRRDGLTSDERRELAELPRRNRVLEMENEILKRPAPTSPGRTSSQNDLPGGP